MITQWPDLEAALIKAAKAHFVGVGASTATPAALEGLRFLRIQVVAGRDDSITDTALVDIEAFAPTRAEARQLAEDVRAWMHAAPGHLLGDALIDTVSTSVRPRWRSYGNPKIHRFVGSYWVSTRQAPVA